MIEEDDWVKLALNDDNRVVQLLLKLKRALSLPPPPPPPPPPQQPPLLRLDWSVRQRRSRQVSRKKDKAAAAAHDAATRASPTTPLSWSGGTTSVSGGGFEESSLPTKTVDTARSKVDVTSETPTTKRSRKKKTLPELKEEEILLLKERRNLKHQLVTLRLTVENQKAENESLKRLKVDLLSRQTPQTVAAAINTDECNSDKLNQIKLPRDASCSMTTVSAVGNRSETSSSGAALQKQEVGCRESSYVLPDLNLPVEDNSGIDVLYGIS
ncbi:uncharacterized protein LOC8283085 [Ricinus communis]|uniref:Uncharacterized protein n=1 Tax=Ricinus communis TaxID=3988 RepID=B9SWS5_RICCO|nr:uncharacterized protein LOC8283085 [Ricinus communis]EEF31914.1 conserved hypothetical protein [Ricinus communis]|eukprot:XP_002530444.1 uncharacterized protein LOC8283085 [Ricinus communis]